MSGHRFKRKMELKTFWNHADNSKEITKKDRIHISHQNLNLGSNIVILLMKYVTLDIKTKYGKTASRNLIDS